ncbi:hypothetical protein F5141DRAFT_1080810, partial [Pisolithus sp. B1]
MMATDLLPAGKMDIWVEVRTFIFLAVLLPCLFISMVVPQERTIKLVYSAVQVVGRCAHGQSGTHDGHRSATTMQDGYLGGSPNIHIPCSSSIMPFHI